MRKYFAQINDNNFVINVIVADKEFIDSGAVGDPSRWIECSIDGAFRNVFPGVGHYFDLERDVFYPPSPFPSWQLNENYEWVPPVPMPQDPAPGEGQFYFWNEENQVWSLISN